MIRGNQKDKDAALEQNGLYLFTKDKNSKYIYVNENFAKAAGFDSPHQAIGKTDYDAAWRGQSEIYRHGDQITMQGMKVVNIMEKQEQANNTVVDIITTKNILFDEQNQISGITGFFIVATGKRLLDISGYFDKKKERFYLGDYFSNEYLTKREFEVFRFVITGFSSNDIAIKLGLSKRTIEDYICGIRTKMQCKSKSEIINQAMRTGLTYCVQEMCLLET